MIYHLIWPSHLLTPGCVRHWSFFTHLSAKLSTLFHIVEVLLPIASRHADSQIATVLFLCLWHLNLTRPIPRYLGWALATTTLCPSTFVLFNSCIAFAASSNLRYPTKAKGKKVDRLTLHKMKISTSSPNWPKVCCNHCFETLLRSPSTNTEKHSLPRALHLESPNSLTHPLMYSPPHLEDS